MINPKVLDDVARRIHEALPQGLRDMQADAEQNLRALLQSTLTRLDLVTREEFEVQSALLARTRAKLEALERRVAELESQQRG